MAEITVTKNFKFLEDLREDQSVAVLEGSTRSTKTISILQYLILWCLEDPGVIIRCFRNDGTTHDKTTVPDFRWVMGPEQLDVWGQGKYNKVEKVFTFDNGSVFSFAGTNDEQKLHGLKQDVAWLNEAMEVREPAWAQIAFRTTTLTIMDFNPSFNHHWIFSSILTRPDVAYNHSTYKDNPFLTASQIREIEKYNPDVPENVQRGTADQYKWDVYGMGKRGKIDGAIFSLWQITDFWPEKHLCQRHGYGMDFGFSNDPTALVECALWNDNLYLREHIYETELLITPNLSRPELPSIQGHLEQQGISKDDKIYADCAMPSAIRDLQTSGYNVIACKKGPDSIVNGLNLMKGRKVFIHRTSANLQLEFEHYTWHKKPDGTYTQKPIDDYNHAIDGARYWSMAELAQQQLQSKMVTGRQQCTKAKNGLRNFR